MQEGWRTVTSETLVKDRWIDLRADKCITPKGHEISPYYVLSYSDWVNVVAITPDEQILLTKQYRHAAGQAFWEIPGGGIDPNDPDPCAAAGRELEEETGYRAEKIELITTLFPNPASHTNRLHTLLAHNVTPIGEQRLEAGEDGLTVHLMPIPELIARVRDGFLGQALHTSSVLMALLVSDRLKTAVA
ncbi:MAG: NUDIX hydrolase [Allorhizobium sp.]